MPLNKSVAWMPLDAIGQAYVEWVLSQNSLPKLVNVVHPRPATWDVILRGLREELGNLPMIPFSQWMEKVNGLSANPTANDLEAVVRTIDFTDCSSILTGLTSACTEVT